MWMKQKIFARHFYPVLRIKFFNPEKLVSLRRRRRFVQIRNFKKKSRQQQQNIALAREIK